MHPLVSVVLPTYNRAARLEGAIESCMAQSYPNWELIIVDDASTDHTPEIVEAFCRRDSRIRSIRHEANRKLPAALNTGFATVRGDLLTWTSDDNTYRPSALESMVAFLEEHSDTGMVYADFLRRDDDAQTSERVSVPEPGELPYRPGVGGCFLYRRAVMETIGPYDESLFGAEDYDYWLRVAGMFKLRALRRELYVYRVHGESLTTTQRDRVLNARERLLRRHLPTMSWASRAARGRGWVIAASISFRRGQVGSAVGALGRALVLNPRYVALHLIRGLLLTGSAALLPRGVRTVD